MSRHCTVVALMTVLPFVVYADELPLSFGIVGGLNSASMQGSEMEGLAQTYGHEPGNLYRGNGGLRLSYALKEWLLLESGLFFSGNGYDLVLATQSGSSWDDGWPTSVELRVRVERKMTFLEAPLAFHLRTPMLGEGLIRLYAMAGMRFGVVVSATESFYGETITRSASGSEDNDTELLSETDLFASATYYDSAGHALHYTYGDFYRWNDLSLTLGAGVEKRFKNSGIFAQVHYQLGLLNFNDLSEQARRELAQYGSDTSTSGVVYLGEPEAFFRTVQISVGLNIYLPKQDKAAETKQDGMAR